MNPKRFLPAILALPLLLAAPRLGAQQPSPAPLVAPPAAPAPAPRPPAALPEGERAGGHEEGEAHHVKFLGRVLRSWQEFAIHVFNFLVFGAILFFPLRGALASAFRARAKELEDQLSRAQREKEEGEAQIRDLEARMAGLQEELEAIMARAAADAETERGRILASARAEAEQIMAQTRTEIAYQQRLAEQELRALVAGLAVEGAARRLETRVQGDVARTAMDDAIQQVGGAQ
jgi:F-type H+-transporting ATPase subunit b